MVQVLAQVRKWLVVGVCVLLAVVLLSYWVARSRVKAVLHSVPQQLGIDIQQTSEGFSLSKSEGGKTLYTIRASKAVQFKQGGHATLRDVHIVVYGHQHERYDQIYGDEFTYNPETGDVNAVGEVHIDLEKNPEGPTRPDQATPEELKNPLHLVTSALTFNQKTGTAHTDDVIRFQTEQATGSAKGAYYDSKQSELQLKSEIQIVTHGDHPATITGSSGSIQKEPQQAVLLNAKIDEPDRTLTADKLTLLFSPDNTVRHVVGEGNVHVVGRGASVVEVAGPRGDLNMGPQNTLSQAIISGGAKFETHGSTVAHGSAERFIVDFEGKNQASRLHMVKDARLRQDPQPAKAGRAKTAPTNAGQPVEIAADQLDFQLADGNQLKTADTQGKALITILPAPAGQPARAAADGTSATTVATAGKFHAIFAHDNHVQAMQGWPESRIVSSAPGEPDKVSTADRLDVSFAPDGGVEKLVQSGHFEYHEPAPNPNTSGRAAFAQAATYVPDDQLLVLSGSPRIVDGGMTTTAAHIRMNRQTGEGIADGDVKTTYSELKPQPDGALLATSDPIHVTAQKMTAHKQPGAAHYSGNVRLWQTANVVRAPKMDFDNEKRSITAQSDESQKVSSLFVQQAQQDGKLMPIDVTADKLTYVDEQRRARYSGNVIARASDGTLTTDQLDVFLKAADRPASARSDPPGQAAQRKGPSLPSAEAPSKIDHMVATGKVIVTQPNRRAVGDRLVYTADDAKYVLTGKSPSIFDAEHGTVWGDSLTFFSRDDRVLVESNRSSPTITRARTSK
jgi:lipopolysaccharide export system protein LptA